MRQNFTVEKLRRDIAQMLAKSNGMDDSTAQWIAARVVEALRSKYGARRIYIPAAEKNAVPELLGAYRRGESVRAVARRLNMSRATLYRLLAMQAELAAQEVRTNADD